MNKHYYEKLRQLKEDHQQYEAYATNQNTVVFAGPGSGKTTILSLKIIRLIKCFITEPQSVACITYSREAVREIKDRLRKYGFSLRGNIFIGTVHSFCITEILLPFSNLYSHFKLPSPFRIISEKEKKELFKSILLRNRISEQEVSISDMDKERKLAISGISNVYVESFDIAANIAREYENDLHHDGFIDFEDIINYSTILLQREDYVRKCLTAKYPWFLIDEYQDLGKPLHEMVLSLLLTNRIKLFAVGDPDQSIYGFQGSMPEFLSELSSFKQNIKQIKLVKNYRSSQPIIDASEYFLPEKKGYIAGCSTNLNAEIKFHICENDMQDQYTYIFNTIIPEYQNRGFSYDDIALLVGTKNEVSELCLYLTSKGIPCYTSIHPFHRTEFIQWLENCLRWSNDNDSNIYVEIESFYFKLLESNILQKKRYEFVDEKLKLYVSLKRAQGSTTLVEWVTLLSQNLNLVDILQSSTLFPDEYDNFSDFHKTITNHPETYTLSTFSNLGTSKNQITISTRHSIKGLEFRLAVLLGMDERKFPFYKLIDNNDQRGLNESQRLFFVCLSRAKESCILLRSKRYSYRSKTYPHEASRYWKQLQKWQEEQS